MQEKKFVLIVEDNDMLRPLLERSMVSLGHRAISVASYREAIQALLVHQSELDALITDQQLDEASGIELARAALQNVPEVKVLIMTGGDITLPEDIVEDVKVFQKPFSVELLSRWLNDEKTAA